jgi:hypothetical protein
MRLSNIIFCLVTAATSLVVTADSDREVRGKCLTDTWRANQGNINWASEAECDVPGRRSLKHRDYGEGPAWNY